MVNVTRGETRKKVRPWTDVEVATLRARYPRMMTKVLAAEMGRSADELFRKAADLELKKDSGYRAATRKETAAKISANRRAAERAAAALNAADPEQKIQRRARLRRAVTALVEHGVDERAAELAIDLVARGRVPAVRVEW